MELQLVLSSMIEFFSFKSQEGQIKIWFLMGVTTIAIRYTKHINLIFRKVPSYYFLIIFNMYY